MTKQEFSQYIRENILILDGATGSNLQREGMPSGVCPELWIAEHPAPLQKLQQAYVEAGSKVVYAPTFGANRIKLSEYGLSRKVRELNSALVRISKEAVGDQAWVAGDMTMTGQLPAPLGLLTAAEMIGAYREQAEALVEAGVDLIVIETMMNLQEMRAALIGVKEACDLPVMATMSFGGNGRTLYGTDPVTAVEVLQSLGADAVGINCSAGPDKMLPVLEKMAAVAKVPLIAKPNAGLPKLGADGKTVYDMEKEPFAEYMEQLIDAGAAAVGGCCGTDPSYIRAVAKVAAEKTPVILHPEEEVRLTTERMSVLLPDRPEIYKIAPSENRELAEEYRNGACDTLAELLEDALDEEPDVICLSVDGEGIDGKAIIEEVVGEACQNVNLPLAFSSVDPEVLEAALQSYPGRAAVVPTGNDREALRILCEKYGAVILTNLQ